MPQVWFGQAVRTIVEGETKFSKLGQLSSDRASSADVKARDLQHLFLAMTKEVRASAALSTPMSHLHCVPQHCSCRGLLPRRQWFAGEDHCGEAG